MICVHTTLISRINCCRYAYFLKTSYNYFEKCGKSKYKPVGDKNHKQSVSKTLPIGTATLVNNNMKGKYDLNSCGIIIIM